MGKCNVLLNYFLLDGTYQYLYPIKLKVYFIIIRFESIGPIHILLMWSKLCTQKSVRVLGLCNLYNNASILLRLTQFLYLSVHP